MDTFSFESKTELRRRSKVRIATIVVIVVLAVLCIGSFVLAVNMSSSSVTSTEDAETYLDTVASLFEAAETCLTLLFFAFIVLACTHTYTTDAVVANTEVSFSGPDIWISYQTVKQQGGGKPRSERVHITPENLQSVRYRPEAKLIEVNHTESSKNQVERWSIEDDALRQKLVWRLAGYCKDYLGERSRHDLLYEMVAKERNGDETIDDSASAAATVTSAAATGSYLGSFSNSAASAHATAAPSYSTGSYSSSSSSSFSGAHSSSATSQLVELRPSKTKRKKILRPYKWLLALTAFCLPVVLALFGLTPIAAIVDLVPGAASLYAKTLASLVSWYLTSGAGIGYETLTFLYCLLFWGLCVGLPCLVVFGIVLGHLSRKCSRQLVMVGRDRLAVYSVRKNATTCIYSRDAGEGLVKSVERYTAGKRKVSVYGRFSKGDLDLAPWASFSGKEISSFTIMRIYEDDAMLFDTLSRMAKR